MSDGSEKPRIVGVTPLGGLLLVIPCVILGLGFFYLSEPWRYISVGAGITLVLLFFTGVFIPRR